MHCGMYADTSTCYDLHAFDLQMSYKPVCACMHAHITAHYSMCTCLCACVTTTHMCYYDYSQKCSPRCKPLKLEGGRCSTGAFS
jgi:hypothetical protein